MTGLSGLSGIERTVCRVLVPARWRAHLTIGSLGSRHLVHRPECVLSML